MVYTDKNNVTFSSFDSNISAFAKKVGNEQYYSATIDDLTEIANENGGELPTTINALEIDWNGANLSTTSNNWINTINSTGELLNNLPLEVSVCKVA